MTREYLIQEAIKIKSPSAPSAREYLDKSEVMTAEVNKLMLERPDLEKLIGKDSQAMMIDNHNNHSRFMVSLVRDYNAEVLVDTVIWVFRAYRAHGFQLTYWPAQLNCWMTVIRKHLSPESFDHIAPVYQFMIVNQASFARLSQSDTL